MTGDGRSGPKKLKIFERSNHDDFPASLTLLPLQAAALAMMGRMC